MRVKPSRFTGIRSKCAGMAAFAAVALCSGAVIITAAGCGGGAGSFSSIGQPSSAIINSAGGSLSSGSASASVPANAVSTSTTFTLSTATGYPSDTRLLSGSAYTIDFGGAYLFQPITFTIGYGTLPTGAVEASLTMYTVVNGAWKAVPGSTLNTTNKTVSASIQSAGTYAIFITQTTTTLSAGSILFERGAHTAANNLYASNTDGSGKVSLIANAAGQYISNARYSPSGAAIAYDYTNGTAAQAIYSMNANGSSITLLAGGQTKPDNTAANNYNPVWSADGSTIAFISDRTGTPEVFTMTSAGGSQTQLTSLVDTSISNIFFTKAGKIGFYATVSGVGSYYQVNTDGTGLASVNATPVNIALISPYTAYNPAGTLIATSYQLGTTGYDLYTFTLNGSTKTRITTLNADAIVYPHFTSDGTKIVFEAVIGGVPSVYIVNADGTNLNNLTVSSGPDYLMDLH
jgi:Tol biopolymer transport system component